MGYAGVERAAGGSDVGLRHAGPGVGAGEAVLDAVVAPGLGLAVYPGYVGPGVGAYGGDGGVGLLDVDGPCLIASPGRYLHLYRVGKVDRKALGAEVGCDRGACGAELHRCDAHGAELHRLGQVRHHAPAGHVDGRCAHLAVDGEVPLDGLCGAQCPLPVLIQVQCHAQRGGEVDGGSGGYGATHYF